MHLRSGVFLRMRVSCSEWTLGPFSPSDKKWIDKDEHMAGDLDGIIPNRILLVGIRAS